MDADPRAQHGYGVRFDWGAAGAQALAQPGAVLVVVDVLSFSTTVSIAVARGTAVHPCGAGGSAADVARRAGAVLAVPRRDADEEHPWSLSPALALLAPAVPRLLLPSRNGSSIAASARGAVVAAGLRNATAVARWVAGNGYGTVTRPVNVVAAGERWPDGALRPALEDLLGAAAVLRALGAGTAHLSPEARAARAAADGVGELTAALRACASGRELAAAGWEDDLATAADADADDVVPLLRDGAFRDAAAAP